ncbi:helix-turn-helix domain-containing protein [Thermolongibacillus altinsuensis]|uniref:helix-turn-helix domain-containing protein n=1 Tax=Thermolongibacillus altinsuensis TaxID=575256 RepID=UPI001FB3966B|nr:helix-turn-helix domain-containing protein [Thermolongibacillus altinsuensis]
MEIYQLLKQGFSKATIAKKLNISRTTLYNYLKRSPRDRCLSRPEVCRRLID